MESSATIKIGNKTWHGALTPLEACQIAAYAYGFYDVDVKPDVGSIKIVAYAKNRKVSAKGASLEEAVEKLIGIFTDG